MITKVALTAGAGPGQTEVVLGPTPLTVFVGPNNAGKSLALREIESALSNNARGHIVASVETRTFASTNEFEELLATGAVHETASAFHFMGTDRAGGLNKGQFEGVVGSAVATKANLYRAFGVRIDGATRLSLANEQALADLSNPPAGFLDVIFRSDELRRRLRGITSDAFGKHFVVDPTRPGFVRIRLSDRPPSDVYEEQALDQRAYRFHNAATMLADFSDGVKAYTGLLAFLLSCRHRIILIDEPDAFLHPPMARKLGTEIAKVARERSAHVFAATHSPDFVIGCISAGVDVQIVRLTFAGGIATARHLPADDLRGMFRNALMRSSNAMSALFYAGAIVTEAAGDSAFYDEVNFRVLEDGGDGAGSCLFLNAQGKDTIARMIGPLRRLGVPAAAIVDVDILKDGGNTWMNLAQAAGLPAAVAQSSGQLRSRVLAAFHAIGRDMKREGGIDLLAGDDRGACQEFFDLLSKYGVFVVPRGELQSWLAHLGATGDSTSWLLKMLQLLGTDPCDPSYVKPGDNDVWGFVRSIARWIRDPNRAGMVFGR